MVGFFDGERDEDLFPSRYTPNTHTRPSPFSLKDGREGREKGVQREYGGVEPFRCGGLDRYKLFVCVFVTEAPKKERAASVCGVMAVRIAA